MSVLDNKLAYTVAEAADSIGVSVSQIRTLIRENKLPARRLGSKILIARTDLEAYLESLPEVA